MIKKTMEKQVPKIDWNDLYKIRIANPDGSFEKHEIIKLMLVMKLLKKHSDEKKYIRIYTEYPITINGETRKCDVYFENIRTKECYAIEVQKDYSVKWINAVTDFYKDWDKQVSRLFFKTADLITIKIDDLSDNISELSKQLDEVIV